MRAARDDKFVADDGQVTLRCDPRVLRDAMVLVGLRYVGQMGEITVPEDGLITIYEPESGEMRRNID